MKRHFKNLREECRYFGVRLQSIAEELKYTQPYVSAVLSGRRQNSSISGMGLNMLNDRKKELKEILNDDICTTRQETKEHRNWDK